MELSENLPVKSKKKTLLMLSTIRVAKNDDLDVSLRIFQIGYLLSCKMIRWKFHCKSSKISVYDKHDKTSWEQ